MNRTRVSARLLSVAALSLLFGLALFLFGRYSTAAAETSSIAVDAVPYAETITYTVQPGDTLTKIATKYGVTVSQLIALNQIQDPNLIQVGQVLQIDVTSGASAPSPTPTSGETTYTVQPGDTLTKIAAKFGVTVNRLVQENHITNPNLIEVGQVLVIKPGPSPTPPSTPATTGGPLSFQWSLISWKPDDPNYIGTIQVVVQGGTPPYTYYQDGLVQPGDTFPVVWRRCRPKPGSIGVSDSAGASVTEQYWLIAPYCPVGLEIVQPEEDTVLSHVPHDFNVTWKPTVDPAPAEYGMEIQVYQDGDWVEWKTFEHFPGDLFLVTGFPGGIPGRLRMWGIYEGLFAGPKTDWRHFAFLR